MYIPNDLGEWNITLPQNASLKMSGIDDDATLLLTLPFSGGMQQREAWGPSALHFHSPSEHSLDGRLFDAEMHIVWVPKNYDPATPYILDTKNKKTLERSVMTD